MGQCVLEYGSCPNKRSVKPLLKSWKQQVERYHQEPPYLKETRMANVKQGNLTKSPQWWKHLKDWKRVFWKSERQAQKREIVKG